MAPGSETWVSQVNEAVVLNSFHATFNTYRRMQMSHACAFHLWRYFRLRYAGVEGVSVCALWGTLAFPLAFFGRTPPALHVLTFQPPRASSLAQSLSFSWHCAFSCSLRCHVLQPDSEDKNAKDVPENPLRGWLTHLRHCRGCQYKSTRLAQFVDLSLTLPEARNVS